MEIPLRDGIYTVNFYFQECCCPGRHFKIALEGEVVEAEVHYGTYDIIDPNFPATGRHGVLTYEVEVSDGVLEIGLLPCLAPECPASTDGNAILDALEILGGPRCDHNGLDFNCALARVGGGVRGTWSGIPGADGYRVLREDQVLTNLPFSARSFADPGATGRVKYTLQALDGDTVFEECFCVVDTFTCASDFTCSSDSGSTEIAFSWLPPQGVDVQGFEILRGGELIATLPANATTFEHTPPVRAAEYTLRTMTNPPGLCGDLTCFGIARGFEFEPPVRLNLGGPTTVDSLGRLWLGDRNCDQPQDADNLGLRPNPLGGAQAICNWCAQDPASYAKYGLSASHPGDVAIFSTIRWDVGDDDTDAFPGELNDPDGGDVDFHMEIPVPNDEYLVHLYFNECCCPARHFKIQIQDEIHDEDVSYLDYDLAPATGKLGRLTFREISVDDGILRIALLPCPDCVGVTDTNAIINAIEIISENECDGTTRLCSASLETSIVGNQVTGTWPSPLCIDVDGYRVYRNGELISELPGTATSFTDTVTTRVAAYRVEILVGAGESACPDLTATVVRPQIPFTIPLRLNTGGPSLVDSRGRLWIGDQPTTDDVLSIRPFPEGGSQFAENWCPFLAGVEADSLVALGLDPNDPNDLGIFNSIRWDIGDDDGDTLPGEFADFDGGDTDFHLEIPIPSGTYLVNLYFTECCCPGRFFDIEIERELVADGVNAATISESGRLGRTGVLSFPNTSVTDGVLEVSLRPCFDGCPGAIDFNSILTALEVLPNDTVMQICPRDLRLEVVGDRVTGRWSAPVNVQVGGYTVFRDGQQIANLPGTATQFEDTPECSRTSFYEVVPQLVGATPLCPDLRLSGWVIMPECSFEAPVRINMGGYELVDSLGRLWLGDHPCNLPAIDDPLGIRPDPFGGDRANCDWCAPDPDSIRELGFDPTHPSDVHLLTTIRWDDGAQGANGLDDFIIEIPISDGLYDVRLYFTECCCPTRRFKIMINDEIVDEDVSYLDYHAEPALGKSGVLVFPDIEVEDGFLRIGLFPCPECPEATDVNAIISAVEVLEAGAGGPAVFARGDADGDGAPVLTDAIFILGYLFTGGGTPPCLEAADVDDDSSVLITDAIYLLGYLFLGTAEPPAPHPGCGPDPTPDGLGCETPHDCR